MKPEELSLVGKHGRLNLHFRRRGERTILADSFYRMPIQVFQTYYKDGDDTAFVYLVNPTGGLVGGDRIDIEVTMDDYTHVFITSQSATKVYRSEGLFSSQHIKIMVKKGGILEYLPGYVIPFAGSLYTQHTKVVMEDGTKAFILDFFTAGRTAMGEYLKFKEYRSIIEMEYDRELILSERLLLKPEDVDYKGFGFFESLSAVAVVYLIFNDPEKEKDLLSHLKRLINQLSDVIGGVSTLPSKGLVVRLIGEGVHSLEKAMHEVWSSAKNCILI